MCLRHIYTRNLQAKIQDIMHQIDILPNRKIKSPKQLEILLHFYDTERMVTTKDKNNIARCSSQTGLSIDEVKKWIGNHNAKLKGTRKGAKYYPPASASTIARQASGFNIFQKEVLPPGDTPFSEMSLWWSAQWKALPSEKIAEYRQRAKEATVANRSQELSQEARDTRKDYLTRKYNTCCTELGRHGVQVASIVFEAGQEPFLAGTPSALRFFHLRRDTSTYLLKEFKGFLEQNKSPPQTQSLCTVNPEETPMREQVNPSSQTQPISTLSPGGIPMTEEAYSSSQTQSLSTINPDETPIVEEGNSSSQIQSIITLDSGEIPTTGAERNEFPEVTLADDTVEEAIPDNLTAMDILQPMSDGKSPSEECEKQAQEKTSLPAKKKRNSYIGKRLEHLWEVFDAKGKRTRQWFQGCVESRKGTSFCIKYDGEEGLHTMPYRSFKKALKEKTLRFL